MVDHLSKKIKIPIQSNQIAMTLIANLEDKKKKKSNPILKKYWQLHEEEKKKLKI